MLITIIFLICLIVGIVLLTLFLDDVDFLFILGVGMTAVGIVGSLTCGIVACTVNANNTCNRVRIDYQEKVENFKSTYNYLSYADDSYAKYTAIQQYNSEVGKFKSDILQEQYSLDNPWFNWMHCPVYREFDANAVQYIVLGE